MAEGVCQAGRPGGPDIRRVMSRSTRPRSEVLPGVFAPIRGRLPGDGGCLRHRPDPRTGPIRPGRRPPAPIAIRAVVRRAEASRPARPDRVRVGRPQDPGRSDPGPEPDGSPTPERDPPMTTLPGPLSRRGD